MKKEIIPNERDIKHEPQEAHLDFGKVLTEARPKLFPYIVGLLSQYRIPSDLAEDFTQEVMLQALTSEDTFRYGEKILPWLREISKNKIIDYVRKNVHQPNSLPNDFIDEVFPSPTPSPYDHLAQSQKYRRLYDAISQLTPTSQVAIKLFLRGASYKEIAHELNISVGAAAVRVNYIKGYLKNKLSR